MPIQGLKFNITTGQERHLSFQATGSFTAYNPNDGYALIALDRTATLLDYDHKLPSQSGGHFPGPINSYLSMYFVDQSGAGLSGQVIVYASPEVMQIPYFWSIGRAIQSQVTSLDLIQGVQPPNPPANTSRLWVDASGHLHIAQSNGTDFAVIDSTNIGAQTVGGDLYGTIGAAHIQVQYGQVIGARNSANTAFSMFQIDGANNLLQHAGGGFFYWQDTPPTKNLMYLDPASGNLDLILGNFIVAAGGIATGASFAGGWPIAGDINVRRGSTATGYIFYADSSHYIGFDGSIFQCVGAPVDIQSGALYLGPTGATCNLVNTGSASGRFDSNLTVASSLSSPVVWINGAQLTAVSAGGQAAVITNSGNGDLVLGGGSSRIYFHPNLSVYLAQNYPSLDVGGFPRLSATQFWALGQACYIGVGRSNVEIGGYTHLFSNGSFYATLDAQATSFTVHSSERYKLNLSVMSDAECLSRLLTPGLDVYSFESRLTEEAREAHDNRPPDSSRPSLNRIGFTAEQMDKVVPEAVAYSTNDNSPDGISYSDLSALMWGAIRALNARLDKAGIVA